MQLVRVYAPSYRYYARSYFVTLHKPFAHVLLAPHPPPEAPPLAYALAYWVVLAHALPPARSPHPHPPPKVRYKTEKGWSGGWSVHSFPPRMGCGCLYLGSCWSGFGVGGVLDRLGCCVGGLDYPAFRVFCGGFVWIILQIDGGCVGRI